MKPSLHRLKRLLLLGILIVTLVAACNPGKNSSVTNSKSFTQNCRTVEPLMSAGCIPQKPERLVTLWMHTLANSLALGVRPIASTYVNGFPMAEYLQGKVDGIESVGGVSDPNLEKILLLKPDLIITTSRLKAVYDHLTHIAPTAVLKLSSPPSSWKQQLSDVAQILGREEAEKQLMAAYWQRIEKLKQALGEQRHQMVISVANTSAEYGIWAYGENHPSGEVLKDVGFQRPPIQQGNVFYTDRISEEILFEIDGDVLFFVSWGRKDDQKTLEKLRQRPLWQHLKAVQNNQVYLVGSHWHGLDILAMNAVLDDIEKYLVKGGGE